MPCQKFPTKKRPMADGLNEARALRVTEIMTDYQGFLRRIAEIIVDASARRFQAKKIYLRAVAAVRWSNARNAIMQSTPHPGQAARLQQTDNNLRNELAGITDSRIVNEFQQADSQAGYWLQDDPSLTTILNLIRSSSP
ncbi:MAG: hypothetical protein Q9174_003434 [Haloplaca sp. 1 TL-2023]